MDENITSIDKNLSERLYQFDEFMKKNQWLSKHRGLDYDELCLFPDVQLPLDFKTLKFSKYDGTENPKRILKCLRTNLSNLWIIKTYQCDCFLKV